MRGRGERKGNLNLQSDLYGTVVPSHLGSRYCGDTRNERHKGEADGEEVDSEARQILCVCTCR